MEANMLALQGTQDGWVATGVTVEDGQRVLVTASGVVHFWVIGYPRDPDGRDEHNAKEIAKSGWPAPGLTQNSLVFRVSTRPDLTLQGGTNASFVCPAGGELEMSNNDNLCADSGHWDITLHC